jgi:hypothetical protein
MRHQRICALSMQKSAIEVYDRGCISNGMVADLRKKGIDFVSGPIQAICRIGRLGLGDHDGGMWFEGEKLNAG